MYFSYIKTDCNAEEAPQVICERLAQGGGGAPQDDDVTFVVVKVK